MSAIAQKEFITVRELADLLGISRIAVFKKIQKGQIKAEKAGRNYIIRTKDITGMIGGAITDKVRADIRRGIEKTVNEYGETLKMLGKE